jgi:hypothetical protein
MSTDRNSARIEALIERSSLGTPSARTIRRSVSAAERARIVQATTGSGRKLTGNSEIRSRGDRRRG